MQSKQSQSIFQSPTFIFAMVFGLFVLVALCYSCEKEPEQGGVAQKGHAEEGEKKKKKKNKTKKPKEEKPKEEAVIQNDSSDNTEPEVVATPKKQEKKQEQPKAKAAAKQNKKTAEAAKQKEQVKEKPKEIPVPIKEVTVPIAKPVVVQQVVDDAGFDSGDSWEVTKDKKKTQISKPQSAARVVDHGSAFGGKTSKGFMVAGPIQQTANKVDHKPKFEQINHASAVADCDYGVSRNEFSQGSKFETFNHVCSSAVAYQRCQAKLSQHELASKVNEKTQVITELENGAGRYNADLVNRIEHALKCKIPRGRAEAASAKKSGKK